MSCLFCEDLAILSKFRTNEQIKTQTVRVIDHTGHQVGIITRDEALSLARQEGLDLVEVSPKGDPPVCRILDYGKWKYQQRKKEHSSRKKLHSQELKEIRFRPKTDKHDLGIKVDRAKRFFADGAKVQLTMIFRGRERLHQDIGMEIFRDIAVQLEPYSKVERPAKIEGRRMVMILAPQSKGSASTKSNSSNSPDRQKAEPKSPEGALPQVPSAQNVPPGAGQDAPTAAHSDDGATDSA